MFARLVFIFLAAFAVVLPAQAHKASDAYLQLRSNESGLDLRVDIALRDLDVALDIDADGDGKLTWGEIQAAWPAIERDVRAGVQVAGCDLAPTSRGLERRSDGAYAVLNLHSPCVPRGEPVIRYTMLRTVDPTHRGIARIERNAGAPVLRVLDPAHAEAAVAAGAEHGDDKPLQADAGFVAEGVRHIVTGYDHVLFLLCLLLPAVMRRKRDASGSLWTPVASLPQAVLPVIGIVTAFTVAHSITLGLAALKLVALPPWFIEPAIAVTIVLAAIDNLWPIFRGRRATITFAFGLIHGFGFAGVLSELNLPPGAFAWALLRFNVGLELGQLLIVLLAVGLLYALRTDRRYPRWVIQGGSVAAIVVGVLWFVERTSDLSLLPL